MQCTSMLRVQQRAINCSRRAAAFVPSALPPRMLRVNAMKTSNKEKAAAPSVAATELFMASFSLYLMTEAPALALDAQNPFAGVQANSLYVTLALFLMCVPGALAGSVSCCV